MNRFCIILTHYFVKKKELEKLPMIEFSIKHFKTNNPNIYIILAGHGVKPNTEYCDHVIWEKKINYKDLGMGHPRLSSKAIKHAIKKNFHYCLKTTCYSIILKNNIFSNLKKSIKNKKLLITQETSLKKKEIGDLFLFGRLDFLNELFDYRQIHSLGVNGLYALGKIFEIKFCKKNNWKKEIFKYCSFEDIFALKWIDLRVHWHKDLKNKTNDLLKNKLKNFHQYLWGYANGKKLEFSPNGKILKSKKKWLSKTEWYNSQH